MQRKFLLAILAITFAVPLFATAASCPNLTRNLSFGSRGSDVVQLQQFLISQNLLATDSATGYFGRLTQSAVQKWQCKNMNICTGTPSTNGWGNVGPRTRVAIVNVCRNKPVINPRCPATPITMLECVTGYHSVRQFDTNGCEISPKCVPDQAPPVSVNPPPPPQSCIPLTPQTQTLACPSGQIGSISQSRTSSCQSGASTPTWSAWQTTSSTCASVSIETGFPTSRPTFVTRLYNCSLGRDPSQSEVDSWTASIVARSASLESVFRLFFLSDEFQSKRFSNTDFVTKLYQCVLYREPDSGGLSHWSTLLSNGTKSRYELLEDFIDSQEFTNGVGAKLKLATSLGIRNASDSLPLGPYANMQSGSPTWSISDKILMTPFFFWYNTLTNLHITGTLGLDVLTHHPISLTSPPLSYASVAWWKKELTDVSSAGIDVILPVYWGFPNPTGRENDWDYGGITTLVQTVREMDAQGLRHPRIGMFYDTSTLEYNSLHRKLDLRIDADRAYFYRTIRDYYSMIPPQYRAEINSKPIVVLYSAAFAAGIDQGAITYIQNHFLSDFGTSLYVVRNNDWNTSTDSIAAWGAAVSGITLNDTVQIGPGYDQTALVTNGDRAALTVDRENGDFYIRNWLQAIAAGKNKIIIETWNELHEGSDIAESREFGRRYIDLSRSYSDLWRTSLSSKQAFIEYLYHCVLGRQSDSGGLQSFLSLPSGTSFTTLFSAFYNSPEYASKQTSNDQYVTSLYSCILGRAPDSGGLSSWLQQLSSGTPRSDLIGKFMSSPEFTAQRGAALGAATGFSI